MTGLTAQIVKTLKDVGLFAEIGSGLKLRQYQREVAFAVVQSVICGGGHSFVVLFPRQSGKNELQAQIETYLLTLLQQMPAEIVKVSPTWKPQSLNAMRRLERVLERNLLTRGNWTKEQGYIYRVGRARIYFLSADPQANIVGATASTLLECDEAQDVEIGKWDKDVAPMAASTNATRVFWGTAWTSQTLLAREKRLAREAEQRDGRRRVFELTADQVRREAPQYGKFVDGEIARHGRDNPYVRTQFFSEEVDALSGMFPGSRLALMGGVHRAEHAPQPGAVYVFCLDVGGEDFNATMSGGTAAFPGPDPQRDATALTVFRVEAARRAELALGGPVFKVVFRKQWRGVSQVTVYRQAAALAGLWRPHRIVVDATGVGEGLASFLIQQFQRQVIPFKFSQASKSALGWKLIALVETGRYQEYALAPAAAEAAELELAELQQVFYEQCARCTFELLAGPGQVCRWRVPEGARSLRTGEPLHDDLLLSAALVGILNEESWGEALSAVIAPADPLQDMRY